MLYFGVRCEQTGPEAIKVNAQVMVPTWAAFTESAAACRPRWADLCQQEEDVWLGGQAHTQAVSPIGVKAVPAMTTEACAFQ